MDSESIALLDQIKAALSLSRKMLEDLAGDFPPGGQRAVAIQQLVNIQNLISQLVCAINLKFQKNG
jgi:hypothetical protein